MNRHLICRLVALYPPAFRDRYGTELASLTDELIRGGELTPLLAALNLLGGAALEWGRVLAYSRHAAEAMAVAAIMAVAGIFYATGHVRPPSTPASVRSGAPAAIRAGTGCVFQAELAGAAATAPWIKAEIKAAARPGQVSWVVVPVTIQVAGKLGTEPGPWPVVPPFVSNALASPRSSPADQCVIWLNSSSAGSLERAALELIWTGPSS